MEFAENKYPPVINCYTLPPSFALERQLIDFMASIDGGWLVSGEMDPMPLDAATLEAIRKNAARYEATANRGYNSVVDIWLRRCDSFEEERDADTEFWNRFSPDERVSILEEMRREWLQQNARSNEGLRRTVRVLDAPRR